MSFLIGELVLYLVLAALIGAVVGFGLGRVTRSRPATTVMFLEADGSSSTSSSAPAVTDELGEDGDGQRAVEASLEASAGGLGAVVGVGGGDDLTRINGVSARFEQALQTMGYSTFSSIAAWSRDDIRRVAAEIDLFRTGSCRTAGWSRPLLSPPTRMQVLQLASQTSSNRAMTGRDKR